MSRKHVELAPGVYAIVEPLNDEEYEAAGDKTLIRLKVLEIQAAKENIREE